MGLPNDDFSQLPHFDWDKAKIFYYVAKFGNMSEAGKFLNLKQPSISRSIGILEDQLNCTLLIRHQSGVKLTRKGEELFSIVEDSFLKLKGFSYNQAVMSNDGQKRKIRISTTHAIAVYILQGHLLDYSASHPDIVFEIITDDHNIDVMLSDIDLAIRPYDGTAKGVHQEQLFILEKKLFASDKYIEKYGKPQTVDDLRNHKVISHAQPEKYPYSDLDWILKIGMPDGQRRDPVFMSSSLENAVAAAKLGLGILGSYSKMSIIQDADLEKILPNLEGPKTAEYIIYPYFLEKDKHVQKIKDYLKEMLSF